MFEFVVAKRINKTLIIVNTGFTFGPGFEPLNSDVSGFRRLGPNFP